MPCEYRLGDSVRHGIADSLELSRSCDSIVVSIGMIVRVVSKVDALSEELQPRSVPAAALQPLYNYRDEPVPISRT